VTEPNRDHQQANATFPPATAADLAGLVEHGTGAVVSRTLAKGQAGTLTLFAFDEGEGISEHSAPFDAWVLVVEGRLRLTIGGKPVDATPGQLVLMPANVPHALGAEQPSKMLLVMLRQ
jgi:quercetin dioxygenase-like cupin family protein